MSGGTVGAVPIAREATDAVLITVYWLLQSGADVPSDLDWLSREEREVCDTLRFAKRRDDWLLGRWTAKQAARRHLAIDADDLRRLEIRAATSGAPEVFVDGANAPAEISLTHCEGRACCALTPRPREQPRLALGCDLEHVAPRSAAFLADYFTDEETALIRAATPAARAEVATLLWSAKESALKALRNGLRQDTRDVTVTPALAAGSGVWQPLSAVDRASGTRFDGWWRRVADCVLTVAAHPSPRAPIAM